MQREICVLVRQGELRLGIRHGLIMNVQLRDLKMRGKLRIPGQVLEGAAAAGGRGEQTGDAQIAGLDGVDLRKLEAGRVDACLILSALRRESQLRLDTAGGNLQLRSGLKRVSATLEINPKLGNRLIEGGCL